MASAVLLLLLLRIVAATHASLSCFFWCCVGCCCWSFRPQQCLGVAAPAPAAVSAWLACLCFALSCFVLVVVLSSFWRYWHSPIFWGCLWDWSSCILLCPARPSRPGVICLLNVVVWLCSKSEDRESFGCSDLSSSSSCWAISLPLLIRLVPLIILLTNGF